VKPGGGVVQELTLLEFQDRKFAALAGMSHSVAEEFSFGGVDESVGSERGRKIGQRPSGGEEQAARRDPVSLLAQVVQRFPQLQECQASARVDAALDQPLSISKRHGLGSMVGLYGAFDRWIG
jgi:hypothetical protein